MNSKNFSAKLKILELIPKYEKLGINLCQAIEILVNEEKIPFLAINYRIKSKESIEEKIKRKKYDTPIEQLEDICGIRIICYYPSDVNKVQKQLEQEFDVFSSENKQSDYNINEFGYRSVHLIVKVKNEWTKTPNYRDLGDLKSEIQIRTVLMHAWAEIEHKLSYKSKDQIPKEFQRNFFRLSAKLEEADEQFEELKKKFEKKTNLIIEDAKKKGKFNENLEFNLDNLSAFLDFTFPNRLKNEDLTRKLFNEMKKYNLKLADLVLGYERVKDIIYKFELESAKEFYGLDFDIDDYYKAQVGIARVVLTLTNDDYYEVKREFDDSGITEKYRNKIK